MLSSSATLLSVPHLSQGKSLDACHLHEVVPGRGPTHLGLQRDSNQYPLAPNPRLGEAHPLLPSVVRSDATVECDVGRQLARSSYFGNYFCRDCLEPLASSCVEPRSGCLELDCEGDCPTDSSPELLPSARSPRPAWGE
eukprot:3533048-Amphidinium_carterae.1